ncbi:unnamed protein product, partial [Schistosoma margrebowiei]
MLPWRDVQTNLSLIDAQKRIPPGSEHNEERSQLKRKLTRSLRNDREQWWVAKARDGEGSGNRKIDILYIFNPGDWIDGQNTSGISSTGLQPLRFPMISSQPEWQVNVGLLSLYEVEKAIGNLKRWRAAGPDRFTPEIFKDGGPVLAMRLTEVLGRIWELDVISSDWSQSLIVPVYKKGQKFSCDSHRGISLTNIVSKILASIILRRLTKA